METQGLEKWNRGKEIRVGLVKKVVVNIKYPFLSAL